MKEFFKTILIFIICLNIIAYLTYDKDNISVTNTPDTTIKKYIDKEANMMCYYTDTWGSCFYVLED